MLIGICKFCEQEGKLVNSHIIPKSFYRLKELGIAAQMDYKNLSIDVRKHQNGLKEPLMCAECDNKLGVLDEYAHKIFFKVIPKLELIPYPFHKRGSLQAKGFNYDKLRKFFISLMWRTSVSSDKFSLGKHEAVALNLLRYEVPDDDLLFLPLIYIKKTGSPLIDSMIGIFADKYLGKYSCRFRFPGYEVIIITNTRNSQNEERMAINREQFTRDEILVIDVGRRSPLDNELVQKTSEITKANIHTKMAKKALESRDLL